MGERETKREKGRELHNKSYGFIGRVESYAGSEVWADKDGSRRLESTCAEERR